MFTDNATKKCQLETLLSLLSPTDPVIDRLIAVTEKRLVELATDRERKAEKRAA